MCGSDLHSGSETWSSEGIRTAGDNHETAHLMHPTGFASIALRAKGTKTAGTQLINPQSS
jgi:hypothetical protein